ncbi:MAG TPA: hypothetical protein VHG32_04295 [Thermoanaerobaculia bacterium]|nr:hypothetical protein [Thermoanaerobaculia bacterium]
MSSSDFTWHLERRDEMVDAGGMNAAGDQGFLVYDLHLARSLIVENPREVRVLRVSTLPVRWPLAPPVGDMDPAFPLILGTEAGRPLILDGFHRLARARQMGIETVNAVVLTEAETGQIRSFRPFRTSSED